MIGGPSKPLIVRRARSNVGDLPNGLAGAGGGGGGGFVGGGLVGGGELSLGLAGVPLNAGIGAGGGCAHFEPAGPGACGAGGRLGFGVQGSGVKP